MRQLIKAGLLVGVVLGVVGCDEAFAYESAEALPIPVLTILAEAGGEGLEGMVAVGNVIRNRAGLRGQTVDEVCLAKWQFSCWNDKGRTVYRYAERNRAVWQDALTAWQLSGTEDVTDGADHYFADYIAMPGWAMVMTETVRVGQHRFFRS